MAVTRKAYLLAFGLAAGALFSFAGTAQVISPSVPRKCPGRQSRRPISVDAEMVLVDVTVTQADGSSVTNLEKGNFQLFEDGIEQEILSLSREDAPISVGLIFDMSGSMSDKVDESRKGALEFLRASSPRDEFFLVSFDDRAELTSPFTFDINELQKSVMSGEPKGHTALLDAIYLGLNQMRAARYSKHALLVISDGGDNHSRYSKTQIKNALKEGDCSLFAVGFFRFKDILRSFEEFHGPGLLSELAEITGGRMFPVARLDDLPYIGAKIGMALRSQYVLGYRPNHDHREGGWRRIKVKVVPSGPLNVNVRAGYYAPRE